MKKEFCRIEIQWNSQNTEFQINGICVESIKEHKGKTVNDLELDFDSNNEAFQWFIDAYREKRRFNISLLLNDNTDLQTKVNRVGFIVDNNFDYHVTLID